MDLVLEMNGQQNKPRFTQYLWPLMDAAYDMKTIGEDILEAVDGDGVPNPRLDGEREVCTDVLQRALVHQGGGDIFKDLIL